MAKNKIKVAYSKFAVVGLVVGLLALLATIVSVVIVLREEKTEVAAQVLASDELTTYHPDLEAKFTYAGEEVTHLWKLKVKFVNSGDKTIIGVGEQSDIIGEGINFEFPDNTRILRVEEEADTFQSNVAQEDANKFQIQFSQWRSGEYSIVSFCVASDEPLVVDPFPRVPIIDNAPIRDIIDGDVVVQNLTEKGPEERMFFIDRLPRVISMPGKIIGGFIAALLALLAIPLFGIGVWGWKPARRLEKWKKRYLTSFSEYLAQIKPPLSNERKEILKENPYLLPKVHWAKFDGAKFTEGPPVFDSSGACIGLVMGSLFMLFGSISLILMLIPA